MAQPQGCSDHFTSPVCKGEGAAMTCKCFMGSGTGGELRGGQQGLSLAKVPAQVERSQFRVCLSEQRGPKGACLSSLGAGAIGQPGVKPTVPQ